MTNKEVLLRNLINHEVFNIVSKLQDLQDNFQILYGNKVLLFDKYNLFDTQINLLRAHTDRLVQLSGRLNADDIEILEEQNGYH